MDTVPKGTAEDVKRAVAAAAEAAVEWGKFSAAKRGACLSEAARLVLENEKELTQLLTKEQGKALRESVLEIRRFAHTLEHYAGMAKTLRGGYVKLDDGRYGLIISKPMGVVGSIIPWNFPVSLMGNKVGPALLAGNAMVIKPASTTPLTATRCVELVQQAGLPKGTINMVTGPGRDRGRGDSAAPRHQEDRFHRRHRYRQTDHGGGRPGGQAGHPRAGRQRPHDRVQRRQHRSGGERGFRGPFFSTAARRAWR